MAVAAAVGGIFTGWRQVKKSLAEDKSPPGTTDLRILQATITETSTLRDFTQSNREVADKLGQVCGRLEELTEATRAARLAAQGEAEEVHRLRIVLADVRELLHAFKR